MKLTTALKERLTATRTNPTTAKITGLPGFDAKATIIALLKCTIAITILTFNFKG